MEKGTGNGHYGICSDWNSDWCSINDMIGMFGWYSYTGMGMVWCGGMYGWCVCIVYAIGIDRLVGGCGRGVSEVQLVSWKTDNSTMGLQEVNSQYHWEKDISRNNKLHLKCVIMNSNGQHGYTQCIKRPVFCPWIWNCIGCIVGTKDNEQYSCSSKRHIEEPVFIKIVIRLWSKVPDTWHWRSLRAWFWMMLL